MLTVMMALALAGVGGKSYAPWDHPAIIKPQNHPRTFPMQMQCEQQAASAAVTDWERGGDITPAPRAISVYCTNLFLRRACLKKKISPAVCATRTDPLLIEAHELFARDYLSKYMSLSEDNFGLKYPKWYIPE